MKHPVPKPIVFIFGNDPDTLEWASDFFGRDQTPDELFDKAQSIIQAADTRDEVIRNLEQAGFIVALR